VLAGCSSTSTGPTTTTTTTSTGIAPAVSTTTVSTAALAQQVLSIITVGNANVQRDKAISDNSVALPKISADFSSAAQQLQALTYPAAFQTDAKALVAILEKLSFDATTLNSTTDLSLLQSAAATLTNDEGTEVATSGALRHDLGLPPVTQPAG
jgi:hypothetical protein